MLIAINYHYIRQNFEAPYPSIFGLRPDAFEAQLLELRKWGEFISQGDIRANILNGTPIPTRSMIITFDDGLKEQYELAVPILRRLGIPAIFYINTAPVKSRKVLNVHKIHLIRSQVSPKDLMNTLLVKLSERKIEINHDWLDSQAEKTYRYDTLENSRIKYLLNFTLDFSVKEEITDQVFEVYFPEKENEIAHELYMEGNMIRELANNDQIGCHSHNHYPVGKLDQEELPGEIGTSKAILEELTDKTIDSFSYPFGSYEACQGVDAFLRRDGFSFAFTMERAVNPDWLNPFYLSRFDTNDVPCGKSYTFPTNDLFMHLPAPSWQFT